MESHAGFELPRDVDVGVNALHRAKSNCAAHARRAVGSVLPRKTASPWTGSFVESAERRSLPTRCWLRRHAAISVSQPRALEGLCAFAAPADVINRVPTQSPLSTSCRARSDCRGRSFAARACRPTRRTAACNRRAAVQHRTRAQIFASEKELSRPSPRRAHALGATCPSRRACLWRCSSGC